MGRPLGSKNHSEDAARLRRECRKVTDKVVRAWIEALEATDADGKADHEVRIKAAAHLADRGYGKPAQEILASVEVNDASADDLHSRIAAIVAVAVSGADAESTGEPH